MTAQKQHAELATKTPAARADAYMPEPKTCRAAMAYVFRRAHDRDDALVIAEHLGLAHLISA